MLADQGLGRLADLRAAHRAQQELAGAADVGHGCRGAGASTTPTATGLSDSDGPTRSGSSGGSSRSSDTSSTSAATGSLRARPSSRRPTPRRRDGRSSRAGDPPSPAITRRPIRIRARADRSRLRERGDGARTRPGARARSTAPGRHRERAVPARIAAAAPTADAAGDAADGRHASAASPTTARDADGGTYVVHAGDSLLEPSPTALDLRAAGPPSTTRTSGRSAPTRDLILPGQSPSCYLSVE